jgi:hypothetical protein
MGEPLQLVLANVARPERLNLFSLLQHLRAQRTPALENPDGGRLDECERVDALRVVEPEVKRYQGTERPGDKVGPVYDGFFQRPPERPALGADRVPRGQWSVLQAELDREKLDPDDPVVGGKLLRVRYPAYPACQPPGNQHHRGAAPGDLRLHGKKGIFTGHLRYPQESYVVRNR